MLSQGPCLHEPRDCQAQGKLTRLTLMLHICCINQRHMLRQSLWTSLGLWGCARARLQA